VILNGCWKLEQSVSIICSRFWDLIIFYFFCGAAIPPALIDPPVQALSKGEHLSEGNRSVSGVNGLP